MSAASIGTLDVPPELSSGALLGIRPGVNGGSGRMLAEQPAVAMMTAMNALLRIIRSGEDTVKLRPLFQYQ
jgi:hypothetical protein